MSNPTLIQYTKKGAPYVNIGGKKYNHIPDDGNNSEYDGSLTSNTESCSIRGCSNTFSSHPPKIFVPFPIQPVSERNKWLLAAGIDPKNPPSNERELYCCEDHFDLKKDVIRLSLLQTINSGVVHGLLKEHVVPHRHTSVATPTPPHELEKPKSQYKRIAGKNVSHYSKKIPTAKSTNKSLDPSSKNTPVTSKIRIKSTASLTTSIPAVNNTVMGSVADRLTSSATSPTGVAQQTPTDSPAFVLKPIKEDPYSPDDNDVMIYEPVNNLIVIDNSSDEESTKETQSKEQNEENSRENQDKLLDNPDSTFVKIKVEGAEIGDNIDLPAVNGAHSLIRPSKEDGLIDVMSVNESTPDEEMERKPIISKEQRENFQTSQGNEVKRSRTQRTLRTRKQTNWKYLADSESNEADEDPDYRPEIFNKKKMRRSATAIEEPAVVPKKIVSEVPPVPSDFGINCGICNSVFSSVNGLRSHHRLSERCGKYPPGTIFKCETCEIVFASQTSLDEHRARVKQCRKVVIKSSTSSSEDFELLSCPICDKTFNSLFTLRFHMKSKEKCKPTMKNSKYQTAKENPDMSSKGSSFICKCCNVHFNSLIGLGLHLKRSKRCIADNPGVDIPGVVDRNIELAVKYSTSIVKVNTPEEIDKRQDMVFVCVKCFSSFSSVWGLRTHERNSASCKPDRPYEIPVPMPKAKADEQKRQFLANNQTESPASSSTPKGVLVVYTQELQNKDGRYQCHTCNAYFTSVWGIRTHHRISNKCSEKRSILPAPTKPEPKTKQEISEAVAKSIAKGENMCPCCSARFSTPWGLRTHLRTSIMCSDGAVTKIKTVSAKATDVQTPDSGFGSGCYLCPQCPNTFILPTSLEAHFLEHSPRFDEWVCCGCKKGFPDQYALHRHFHRDHLGQWFCIMCSTSPPKSLLSSFKEFYTHIFNNHYNKENANKAVYFKCMTCYRSFLSKLRLDQHVRVCKKVSEQIFTCASCFKVFTKKIHITNHMKYAHPGVDIDHRFTYKCPRCPQKFLSQAEFMTKHSKAECLFEGMPCDICGDLYMGVDKLKEHVELCHTTTVRPKSKRKKTKNPNSGNLMNPTVSASSTSKTWNSSSIVSSVDDHLNPIVDEVDVSMVKIEPGLPANFYDNS